MPARRSGSVLSPRLLWVVVCTVATSAGATPVTSRSALTCAQLFTVDFNELGDKQGQQFGYGAGQPYTGLGLTMGDQVVQDPNPDMGSDSEGIAVHSALIYAGGNTNVQSFSFASAQACVGFYVRDSLASSIEVKALGQDGATLETVNVSLSRGYVGFARSTADIARISISAPHATLTDANASRTYVDDLSFVVTKSITRLVRVDQEPAGLNCAAGGAAVRSGYDFNENHVLDTSEVSSTVFVCNGSAGSSGSTSLVDVQDEAAGANCPNGGLAVRSGVDTNGNGVLETSETLSTSYVCNGSQGTAGEAGLAALIRLDPDGAAGQCPAGGVAVYSGLDENGDGVLQTSEVDSTAYVCRGDTGLSSLLRLDEEPAGSHCTNGGTAIRSGVDQNRDGVLSDAEVTSTRYVCNGANGADGAPGPKSTGCSAAGGGLSSGLLAVVLWALRRRGR